MMVRLLHIFLLLATLMAMPGVLRADTVDAGKDTIKEYLQALEANPNDKEALKIVGFYYMNRGDYHKATRYAKRLLDLGKASGDRDFCELYGRVIIGSIMIEDEPDSCFRCLERARSIAESTSNRDALLSVNNGLGMYYLLVHNDPYTASTYYYEALEDAKAIGDERRYGIILSNLSGVYISLNDISGLKLAEQSYQIARKRGEPMPLYYAAYSLAHFYLMTDSLDRAGYFIDEVERLHGAGGFDGNGNPYLYRARLAEKRGDIDAAYGYYVDAMQNFGDSDASSVSATYLDYARLLRRDGHAASAIKVLEYALRYIASKMKIHSPELMKELVYSYRDAGDYRKAMEYSLRYQEYQDSAMQLSRERTLQENRIRHEVYTNERLLDEKNMELMDVRHKIVTLLIVVIAVFALLALTYINYRRKDRLYRAIVSQNSEYLAREQALIEQIEESRSHHDTASSVPPMSSGKVDGLMSGFTRLMLEEKLFTDPSITVGAVAERLGSNRTYLSKAINESTGKTFTQVVNEYRIREAVALISDLDANIPLKQVCADVGFNSLSTFYTSFQAGTGMTPASYRERVRNMQGTNAK